MFRFLSKQKFLNIMKKKYKPPPPIGTAVAVTPSDNSEKELSNYEKVKSNTSLKKFLSSPPIPESSIIIFYGCVNPPILFINFNVPRRNMYKKDETFVSTPTRSKILKLDPCKKTLE
ncbi:hypothetical protein CDAR_212201 [Caerostris darwini]|uniref:Uncharacterized protein n=1 Tax=Caerostris darwini TaxID=1538125 RepID=A0AAV4NS18_9ARAC|nr:hypothetical protein CDAR_212201 [Caerostris darwini]